MIFQLSVILDMTEFMGRFQTALERLRQLLAADSADQVVVVLRREWRLQLRP
jgi:hypothetical protein